MRIAVPRAGLVGCGKLSPPPALSPDRPARSESLYPGPQMLNNTQQYSLDCSREFNNSYLLSRAIIITHRRNLTEKITQRWTRVLIMWVPWGRTGVQGIRKLRVPALNPKHKYSWYKIPLNVLTVKFHFYYKLLSSSSSCSWRVRRVSCSLILKMKLVPPSLPRTSYVPSSFWFIL